MRQKLKKANEEMPRIAIELHPEAGQHESMRERIERVREDLNDLQSFYNIQISNAQKVRLKEYIEEELASLKKSPFKSCDQQGKIDYLLLQNFLKRDLKQLELNGEKDQKMEPLILFAATIIRLCEDRQMMKPVDGEKAANNLFQVTKQIWELKVKVTEGEVKLDRTTAFRAANSIGRLRWHLAEWFGFFKGYDPMFTWWVGEPYSKSEIALEELAAFLREKLVGIKPGDGDAIVGQPIGKAGLLADLEAEMIPYSPEELIQIGEEEYVWCEAEMKKAS